MKKITVFFLTSIWFLCSATAQTKTIVDREIFNVKSIPFHYSKFYSESIKDKPLLTDASYLKIKSLDTLAIPYLILKLSDTSITSIENTCLGTKYKVGDIAFFLINDIEPIPYGMVTGGQYCTMGQCGVLPDGFITYLNNQREKFYNAYRIYYYGDKRKEWLEIIHPKKKTRKNKRKN